ncbi:hypothetical protein HK102_011070, partial [Quaeritorhiza haematococci]
MMGGSRGQQSQPQLPSQPPQQQQQQQYGAGVGKVGVAVPSEGGPQQQQGQEVVPKDQGSGPSFLGSFGFEGESMGAVQGVNSSTGNVGFPSVGMSPSVVSASVFPSVGASPSIPVQNTGGIASPQQILQGQQQQYILGLSAPTSIPAESYQYTPNYPGSTPHRDGASANHHYNNVNNVNNYSLGYPVQPNIQQQYPNYGPQQSAPPAAIVAANTNDRFQPPTDTTTVPSQSQSQIQPPRHVPASSSISSGTPAPAVPFPPNYDPNAAYSQYVNGQMPQSLNPNVPPALVEYQSHPTSLIQRPPQLPSQSQQQQHQTPQSIQTQQSPIQVQGTGGPSPPGVSGPTPQQPSISAVQAAEISTLAPHRPPQGPLPPPPGPQEQGEKVKKEGEQRERGEVDRTRGMAQGQQQQQQPSQQQQQQPPQPYSQSSQTPEQPERQPQQLPPPPQPTPTPTPSQPQHPKDKDAKKPKKWF